MSTASRPSVELIDRAVLLVALTRLVPLAAAPLTLWLVATTRPMAEQGAYFIFWNAQALTQLMEIGVGTLIVQFASHDAAAIAWDDSGDVSAEPAARQRLIALIVVGRRWYVRVATVVLAVGAIGGTWLLESSLPNISAPWVPWIITIAFTAAYLPVVPTLCAIEGAGGLIRVQRMRLIQVASATLVLWAVLLRCGALWGVAAFAVAWYLVAIVWLRVRHAGLLGQLAALLRTSPTADEPHAFVLVQWRTAVTWLAWWAAPQALTPIVLATHGPVAAGQVGMSLAIATAPLTLATAWLYGRYPRYGSLIAAGRVDELRRVARLATFQAAIVCATGTIAVAIVVLVLSRVSPVLSARVLPFTAILLLGAGNLGWLCVQSLGAYLRAWRADPLAEAAVVGAIITAVGTLVAANQTTSFGTVATHAFMVLLGVLPLSWLSRNARQVRSP